MKKLLLFLMIMVMTHHGNPQPSQHNVPRPKLVVGIVVDQMRWDYLYRYYDRYSANGGFKKLLQHGFSFENATIPYIPAVTACGHTSMYTGTVPAIHGITGNDWWDEQKGDFLYCTDDETVATVGSTTQSAGAMSPRNLLTTTICDELKLATNFKSKVIGISLKDRCSILPAGHSADAAYWYDTKTGNLVSSTYYMKDLPSWVTAFNGRKLVDSFYKKGWNTLHPVDTYQSSTTDNKEYENRIFGNGFPYTLSTLAGKNYNPILVTPFGNTLISLFAREAIIHENLGKDNITDFLSISFSSPDYVGHSFGPNSIEEEDIYLRLDKELGELLDFLDKSVGKNQYLLFLSSDHGVAHVPGFLTENRIPAGNLNPGMLDSLNGLLKSQFGTGDLVVALVNYQAVLNIKKADSLKLNNGEIRKATLNFLSRQKGITQAIDLESLSQAPINTVLKNKIVNGYFPGRSGQLQYILSPHWIEGFEKGGTTHGAWNPYDAHIPLIWYGWNIPPGKSFREVNITDIAPTLAAILKIQMPSGNIGKVTEEVVR